MNTIKTGERGFFWYDKTYSWEELQNDLPPGTEWNAVDVDLFRPGEGFRFRISNYHITKSGRPTERVGEVWLTDAECLELCQWLTARCKAS